MLRLLHRRALSTYTALPVAIALAAALLTRCGSRADVRYASPAQTWQTYADALDAGDADAAWACFSPSYRRLAFDDRAEKWRARVTAMSEPKKRAYKRFEIVEERVLNKRLAYLLFDATTLPSDRRSPFAYFLREADGWKMTTHLDTVFHRELEGAIARGEYHLPRRD